MNRIMREASGFTLSMVCCLVLPGAVKAVARPVTFAGTVVLARGKAHTLGPNAQRLVFLV